MVRTIAAPEAEATFADVIGSVETANETVIVEREGRPVAVVINPAAYERLLQLESERNWETIDRLRERNAGKDPDDVFADVTAEVEEVRRSRRDKETRRA